MLASSCSHKPQHSQASAAQAFRGICSPQPDFIRPATRFVEGYWQQHSQAEAWKSICKRKLQHTQVWRGRAAYSRADACASCSKGEQTHAQAAARESSTRELWHHQAEAWKSSSKIHQPCQRETFRPGWLGRGFAAMGFQMGPQKYRNAGFGRVGVGAPSTATGGKTRRSSCASNRGKT